MRRLWPFLAILVGCGDGNDGAGHLADAPPPPPPDAAPDAAPNDGPVVDAPPDAPIDAPPPLPVFLRILKNGNPAPEVLVYFQNADNSVVATVNTDADGIAQAVMVAGGYVTAINPFPPPPAVADADELRTFAGVKPGDHLVLTHDDDPAFNNVSVTVPEILDGTRYEVHSTCGSGDVLPPPVIRLAAIATTGLVPLLQSCTTADFLVISHRNVEGDRLDSAFFHPDVTVAGAEGIDFTTPPPDSYSALTIATFSYSNAPNIGSVLATHYLATPRGMFDRTFEGTVFLTDGVGSVGLDEPNFQAGLIGILDTCASLDSQHHVLQWGPNSDAYETDMTGVLLRDVTTTTSYDIASKQLRWGEDTTGATPDLTTAEIQVTHAPPDDPTRRWNWRIAAPYTTGTLQYPVLPVETWTAVDGDGVSVARHVNAKVPGGYDLARPHALDVQDRGNITSFVFGAAGRAVTVGTVDSSCTPR